MAEHSGIGEFSGEAADWNNYIERLEHFFVTHDITEANKKRATLLSECGAATYKVIRSVVAPQKPNEFEYAALVKKIQEHFMPKLSLRNILSLILGYDNPESQWRLTWHS